MDAGNPRRGSAASSWVRRHRVAWPKALVLIWALAPIPAAAEEPAAAVILPPVEVIGTTPLPGLGLGRQRLPYSSQRLDAEALRPSQGETVLAHMNRRLAGVQLNDVQGNPFQRDPSYRGFRASSLLGTAQGLSVYLDGVRINEPFGDVVNWEMVPEAALRDLTLVSAANPAFGLNSLGGAIVLRTEDGFSAPGLRTTIQAGSFGRRRLDLSHGLNGSGGWHSYLAATGFEENGWRDASAGQVTQLLAKGGHHGERRDWDLTLRLAQSRLSGNGLVPAWRLDSEDDELTREPDLYRRRASSVYTYPDESRNRVAQLQADLREDWRVDGRFTVLAYLRRSLRNGRNGDEAEAAEDEPASFNDTWTRQLTAGAATSIGRRDGAHQWQLGAMLDLSRSRHEQASQPALFTEDREVQRGDATPRQREVRVRGDSVTLGLYATDSWTLDTGTTVAATLRHNHARIGNRLARQDEAGGALSERPVERFTYDSLNPALGLTHPFSDTVAVFANLARNNRVPTAIELGCADPADPCRLPVGLQSDPYLKQVISYSGELGLRWKPADLWHLELTGFRSDNRDDILFRSVSINGQQGYFENFPRTRHQGLDLSLNGGGPSLQLGLHYSRLEATYEADGLLRQGERSVIVAPGTRIAGLSRHLLKASVDWQALPRLKLSADVQAWSRRRAAGNEDGRVEDDGAAGQALYAPGAALLHLHARWTLPDAQDRWVLFARVDNLLDHRHETWAALAETVFDTQGRYTGDEQDALFVGPGSPRHWTLGLEGRF